MSYSSYVSSLESKVSDINNTLNSISNISFDTNWSGSAASNLTTKLSNLLSETKTQIGYISNLSSAMNNIDNYDNTKKSIQSIQASINSYSSVPKWYNSGYTQYKQLTNSLEVENQNLTTYKGNVNSSLNAISSNYNVKYKVLEFDDIVSTKSTFDTILNGSEEITNGLDLSQVVTQRYRSCNADTEPDWSNYDAWQNSACNCYINGGNTGQCTWFAAGMFYQVYGYQGWVGGNGRDTAYNLASSRPDDFYISTEPATGSVFSYQGGTYGHTGFVLEASDGNITIFHGNMNGKSDSFEVAQGDWKKETMTVDEFKRRYSNNVVFANPY